nr:hypothetical protein [Tanacetum cinerariifolium]
MAVVLVDTNVQKDVHVPYCEAPKIGLTALRPLPFDGAFQGMKILSSFHGLLCIGVTNNGYEYIDIVLWNPVTAEYKILSKNNSQKGWYRIYGSKAFELYYSSYDDDYKLLHVTFDYSTYIYSLKFDSWRKVGFLKDFTYGSEYCILSNWLNEKRYTLKLITDSRRQLYYSIIRFDLKTEKFTEVASPSFEQSTFCLSFMVLKGRMLCSLGSYACTSVAKTLKAGLPGGAIHFKFQKVAEGDRIALASFHLDGIVLQWHRWYTKAQGPVTWAEFTKALLVRFGPTEYEDPSEALHRLKQSTTVVIYQETFERLSNRVEGLPESFLVCCFIGGLKDEIRLEVKLKKPRRLVKAMGMARLVEEKNNLARKPFTPNRNVSNPGILGPAPTTSEKGLCYYCDDKYTPRHKCSKPQFFMIDDAEETENENPTNDALETQADEVQGKISFHAISGTILPQTLQLPGRIQNKEVVVLVDGGSCKTHMKNTINLKFSFTSMNS